MTKRGATPPRRQGESKTRSSGPSLTAREPTIRVQMVGPTGEPLTPEQEAAVSRRVTTALGQLLAVVRDLKAQEPE